MTDEIDPLKAMMLRPELCEQRNNTFNDFDSEFIGQCSIFGC